MDSILIALVLLAAVAAAVVAAAIYLQRSLRRGLHADAGGQSFQRELIELRERLQAREEKLSDVGEERDQARREHRAAVTEIGELQAKIASLETRQREESRSAAEKLEVLKDSEKRLSEQFENLANRIFEEKQEKFAETSKAGVKTLLQPVREQLEGFRKKVEDVYDKESKDRNSLLHHIKDLKKLNEAMSDDARNLTSALKGDNKAQGNWGEIQLERILEVSGLVRGREYEVQASARDEEGKRYIPDVIVHLPEKKDVIIDSKVSLLAYDRYHSAATEAEREAAIKQHVASLRGHIKSLSEKKYQDLEGVNSLDFAILFVPIDAALLLAQEHDASLTDSAFSKNIWLVSPVNLVGTLRIIHNIWRFEYQNRNALEIATRAGRLHDKFVSFAESLMDVGRHLGQTQQAYDKASKQLSDGRGNLVNRVLDLQKLGAKTSKSLPRTLVQEAELVQEADPAAEAKLAPPDDDEGQVLPGSR